MINHFPFTDPSQIPIVQLQWYLLVLSRVDPRIPRVNVDGIYGPQTTASVTTFQELYGLPANGAVDLETWKTIRTVFIDTEYANAPAVPVQFWSEAFSGNVIRQGEHFDIVFVIQIILNSLGLQYEQIGPLPVSGNFDQPTEDAVRVFQSKNGIPVTGIVDKQTWNLLADAYRAFSSYE